MIRRLRHRVRRGAGPFVDFGWALAQFVLLVGELATEAWADLRAKDRRRATASTTPVTRAHIRKATIHALRKTKADPRSLRLTPGQARHIRRSRR